MDSQRDDKGRFRPGCPGGPGRPPRAVEREYLAAVVAGCSLEDWGDIVGKAVADAKVGDRHARQWLASYLCPAAQRLEVSTDEPSQEERFRVVLRELTEPQLEALQELFQACEREGVDSGIELLEPDSDEPPETP